MTNKKIKKRVELLVESFKVPRNKTQKLAYRYLFSTLKALEDIAVLAAERGAGVKGQLEDEYVHRDTFKQIADLCGGYEDVCDNTQKLIDYLENLEGENSIAALNVVAEGWLSCVFVRLTPLSPELFGKIGEDEARHNGYALSYKIPDSEELESIIRNLEKLLLDIVKSVNFVLPMIYLLGLESVGKMGLEIIESHKRACAHMGVDSDTDQMKKFCRSSILASKTMPEEIEITDWQHNQLRAWDSFAHTIQIRDVKIDTNNKLLAQAKIIEAVGNILTYYPEYRNVTRDKRLFRTKKPLVGLRVPWDDDHLSAIYLTPKNGYRHIAHKIIAKIKKIRKHPYEKIADVHHIKDLIPPSQCSVMVSTVGLHEGANTTGWSVSSELEGIPITVFLLQPRSKEGKFWNTRIVLVIDHRVQDGKRNSLFGDRLNHYLVQNASD